MDLIAELSTVTPPDYAKILRQFPLGAVAKKAGISYAYTSNVLRGLRRPSKALERRLIDLAEQVKAEQKTA